MNEPTTVETARMYDQAYQKDNYFGCRRWLYRPYVKALIAHLRMERGATVLDAGCGQGVFTDLFAQEGMCAFGVDISPVGIQKAKEQYPALSDHLFVGDLNNLSGIPEVDCIFIRCCSLYNVKGFTGTLPLTLHLMEQLKPGGTLIFAHSSNLSRTGKSWVNHGLADVDDHFDAIFSRHETYFINKLDTFALGGVSFNRCFTELNGAASRVTGRSGDIIVFARKEHLAERPAPGAAGGA